MSEKEATPLDIGEMAFEHKCQDGAREIWRVFYWRGWNGRRVRCSDWFGSEETARILISRIESSAFMELISVTHYAMSDYAPAAIAAIEEGRDA